MHRNGMTLPVSGVPPGSLELGEGPVPFEIVKKQPGFLKRPGILEGVDGEQASLEGVGGRPGSLEDVGVRPGSLVAVTR